MDQPTKKCLHDLVKALSNLGHPQPVLVAKLALAATPIGLTQEIEAELWAGWSAAKDEATTVKVSGGSAIRPRNSPLQGGGY